MKGVCEPRRSLVEVSLHLQEQTRHARSQRQNIVLEDVLVVTTLL